MPRFSVIIPTYNAAATLGPLLQSLAPQTGEDTEIIVVDDASTDATPAVVAAHGRIQYVRQAERRGPAAARNRGAALAAGEWLVFTDADTCCLADTMERIRETVSACEGDAFVGTYAGRPANKGFMPRYKALWELVTVDERLLARGGDYVPYTTWAPRPGLVKKSVFEAVGGFNERFRGADLEDMEFGYRMVAAGYRIFFVPGIRILHNYPATFWQEIRPFARRCRLWVGLKKPDKFDLAGDGSPWQAVSHMAGFGAFWLLFLIPFLPASAVLEVPLFLVFVGVNRAFIARAFCEEGFLFAARALPVCWIHTIVMGCAAGLGMLERLGARR